MIKIHDQEIKAWIAKTDGWVAVYGVKATIAGIDCSLVTHQENGIPKILVSELTSGAEIRDFEVSMLDFIAGDTKERAFVLFKEIAQKTLDLIERVGVDKVKKQIESTKKDTVKRLGEMPKIEAFYVEKG